MAITNRHQTTSKEREREREREREGGREGVRERKVFHLEYTNSRK